jgi:twitching motility protein PilT
MKTIEELLKNLARPEVLEFGLVTNRLPSVNIGGKFEPVDDEAPSTERLMQMLVTMGGSRYVDSLSDKPVQWTTRLDGVGVIAVAAIMRKDVVQARFTVAKREVAAARPSAGPSSTPSVPSARPSDKAVASASPASGVGVAARPATQQASSRAPESRQVPTAAPSPQPTSTKVGPTSGGQPPSGQARAAGAAPASSSTSAAVQIQPQAIKNVVTTPSTPPVRAQAPAAPPPEDEWDDDDEPTLQTLSPPVTNPPGGPGGPRPKPARRPEDAETDASREKAAQDKAAAEKAAAEKAAVEKAAQEKAAAEKAAVEKAAQEKAAAEKAAQEKTAAEKAAQEKAAAEKAAQEKTAAEKAAQEKAAAEKAAAEKVAREKAAAEKAAAEKAAANRAAAEKAAAEKAAAEKAAQERAAQEKVVAERAVRERAAAEAQRGKAASPGAIGGRRIATPTSVDAVDVEITTNDGGSGPRPVRLDIDLDADGSENTLSVPGADGVVSSETARARAGGDIPPSAVAEKDRPRVDVSATIDAFLAMAVAARASDLFIVASRPILLRVATDLIARTQPITADHVERIAKEIVPVRLRETLERDGQCDFAVEHPTYGRFRVNVSRQRTGFKMNLRVIPREIPTIASLGLPDVLAHSLRHQRGLILVTGPAGHGKSTTLAALVDHLNRETARHIMTVEEAIEHVHPRKKGIVSQRDVGLHARSRARTVQTALREDVDTLVISEMRDADAVRHALVACEGGRLVLGAMNMPSAAKTVDRILDLFSPSEEPWVRASLASSLRLIVGQRLVPSADRTRLHAAVELLPGSIGLYTLIRDGRTHQIPELQNRGKGVVRLDDALAELVRTQKVTPEVAKQFAESPTELAARASRPAIVTTAAVQARKA